MMRMSPAIALLLVIAASACGSHPASVPVSVAPSPVSQPTPTPAFQQIEGYVADTAFRAIAGAAVTIMDGPQAGASTTTDAAGRFHFAGSFANPTTVRASNAGYSDATAIAKWNNGSTGYEWAYVQLDLLSPPVDLVGDYTLTFVADNACTGLPSELRTRTYAASIATADSRLRPGTSLTLTTAGATFVGKYDGFPIGVAGDDVAFLVYYQQEDFGLVEQTAPNTYVAIQGIARLSVNRLPVTTITVPLNGIIDYCALQSATGWNYDCNSGARVAYSRCESSNHQLTLTRR